MYEISCDAVTVEDTYCEGIEYLYCRHKFNIIDDTIRIFVELKNVILIHGNFNK